MKNNSCPNCGAYIITSGVDSRKVCSAGCGYDETKTWYSRTSRKSLAQYIEMSAKRAQKEEDSYWNNPDADIF